MVALNPKNETGISKVRPRYGFGFRFDLGFRSVVEINLVLAHAAFAGEKP